MCRQHNLMTNEQIGFLSSPLYRYETKCFQRNLSPNIQMELPTESLSQLTLNSGLTKSVSTSVASSTSIKRIQTGSQKVTTSFNSIERKN